MIRYITIGLLFFLTQSVYGQRVTVSEEITVRRSEAYNIIGKVGDHIISMVDKGKEQTAYVFDDNLRYLYSKDLRLTDERYEVQHISSVDSFFNVYYGTKDAEGYAIHVARFNENATRKDTVTLIDSSRVHGYRNVGTVLSKDKSKLLFFSQVKRDQMHMILIDNRNLEVIWEKLQLFQDIKVRNDFRKVFVTNDGQVNMLFQQNNDRRNRADHRLYLYGIDGTENIYLNTFSLDNRLTVNLECIYDEKNKNIVIAGLSSEKDNNDPTGYFSFIKKLSMLDNEEMIASQTFDQDFLRGLYGEALGKNRDLHDFLLRRIVLREDGGFLLLAERHKEFYRQSQLSQMGRYARLGDQGSGWLDTYDEDVVVIAVDNKNSEAWKSILFKKQFSQDEDFIYSSFFLFINPSSMRVIYNDEIKRNNTVSEYVIDPLGNNQRYSVLSTDYQDLKLVFEEAIQISADSFIVPSERAPRINLVKIDYE